MPEGPGILDSSGNPIRKNAGIGLGFSIVRAGPVIYLQVTPTRPAASAAEAAMLQKTLLGLVLGKGFPMNAEMAATMGKALKQAGREAAAFVEPTPEQEGGNGAERATEPAAAEPTTCLACLAALPCACMHARSEPTNGGES